jgi:ABC-type multidrug transport system ATPase subunit
MSLDGSVTKASCAPWQPNSDIFRLFDQVMLLVTGRVVYYGPAATAVNYFAALGYECPQYANPADFFLSLCNESDDESPYHPGITSAALVAQLVAAYKVSRRRGSTVVVA